VESFLIYKIRAPRLWVESELTYKWSRQPSPTRPLVGLASPKEMILSNQRKHYPGIGLLTDEERDRT